MDPGGQPSLHQKSVRPKDTGEILPDLSMAEGQDNKEATPGPQRLTIPEYRARQIRKAEKKLTSIPKVQFQHQKKGEVEECRN